MNILPSNTKEFLSKSYWDKFFGKLKDKGEDEFFEWYGNFKDFEPIMSKLLKNSDSMLNIGCGKSLFSEDMYDDGFTNILNVDYSEQVIKDMIQRSKDLRPNNKYEVMDVFNMTYQENQFKAVLDKGCLDAVYPDGNEDTKQQVLKLFDGIIKVGSDRYMFISLLQEHIIETVLDYFGRQKGFKINIYEVLIKNSKMYPFLVDIQFCKSETESVCLTLKSNPQPIGVSFDECKEEIKKIQMQNHFMGQIKKCRTGQRFNIDLWDAGNQKTPKYTLNIVDSKSKKTLESKTCGCFIAPQGRENGYLFATEKGNFDLLEQTGMSRLIIAILNPGFVFDDLKKVQADLSPAITDCMPKGCSNAPVPFMTDADELGEKGIMIQDNDLVVEEIIIDEDVFRRLILKSNFNQVQSQFKLGYQSTNNSAKQYLKDLQTDTSLLPEKKNMWIGIDESYLDFEAHRAIIAGLALFRPEDFNIKEFKMLVLGGGLCGLGKFVYNHFPHVYVTNVEISQTVCDIAKSKFEVIEDDRLKLVCSDAIKYIDKKIKTQQKNKQKKQQLKNKKKGNNEEEQQQQQQETQEQEQEEQKEEQEEQQEQEQIGNPNGTDFIVIDINGKMGETSPPEEFLSEEFLQKLQGQLKPHTGVLAINVVAFGEKEKKPILEKIEKVFGIIYSLQTESDLNEVFFAINHNFKKETENNGKEIVIVEEQYIQEKKQLDQNFKNLQKLRNKLWDQTLNIDDTLRSLKLRIPRLSGGTMEQNNYHLKSNDGQSKMSNKVKDQYMKDLGCISKSQQKKKKRNGNK